MNTTIEKELPIEPAETGKTFYIVVNYYDGVIPYASLTETRDYIGKSDEVFIVKIPYKQS